MDGSRQASTNAKGLYEGTWHGPSCLSRPCNHTQVVIRGLLVHKSVIGVTVSSTLSSAGFVWPTC